MTQKMIKQQVQDFYDRIGWQEIDGGCYQNAAYEDLRPVAGEYIHNCHLRILRHIRPQGRFFLDAGSGPIQYPEYLEYSKSYQKRVCVDLSIVALQEARNRIGDHGFFIIADIANLPFKPGSFEAVVSLHTIHHLPAEEHISAYQELHRVLETDAHAVIVNGWDSAPLTMLTNALAQIATRILTWTRKEQNHTHEHPDRPGYSQPTGTFIRKHNSTWLQREVGSFCLLQIWTWRSVNVRFLRTFVHERWGGRTLLHILYALEEHFPHFFGKIGQYPLIVMHKRSLS
jgi:SAM-dependent methyltransferase